MVLEAGGSSPLIHPIRDARFPTDDVPSVVEPDQADRVSSAADFLQHLGRLRCTIVYTLGPAAVGVLLLVALHLVQGGTVHGIDWTGLGLGMLFGAAVLLPHALFQWPACVRDFGLETRP